jgi:hypothetical protein
MHMTVTAKKSAVYQYALERLQELALYALDIRTVHLTCARASVPMCILRSASCMRALCLKTFSCASY